MQDKQVLILLRHPPHGSLFVTEGLRMAVALSGDRTPGVLAVEDGVYAFLKDTDKTIYQPHLDFLKECGITPALDRRSVDARGLTSTDFVAGVDILEQDETDQLLAAADLAIPF